MDAERTVSSVHGNGLDGAARIIKGAFGRTSSGDARQGRVDVPVIKDIILPLNAHDRQLRPVFCSEKRAVLTVYLPSGAVAPAPLAKLIAA
jgi:hypothetical protein